MSKFLLGNRYLWVLKLIVVAVALGYVAYSIFENYEGIRTVNFDAELLIVFFITVLIWLCITLSGSIIWWILIGGTSSGASFFNILRLFLLTQIGKYLPGNVGQYVGRVAMAAKLGIPYKLTVASIVLEIIWALSVTGLLGAVGGMLLFEIELPISWTILLVVAVGAFLLPLVLPFFVRIGKKFVNLAFLENLSADNLSWKVSGKVFALYLMNFFLLGGMCWLHLQWIFEVQPPDVLTLMCINALIWVIGYVVPGAPGGIGVRESTTIILLAPLVGGPAASGVAISMRLASVVGDFLGFMCGLSMGKLMRNNT